MTISWKTLGRNSGGCETSMASRLVVGFISVTDQMLDPGSVGSRKSAIDVAAVTFDMSVDAYLVEMSPRRAGETWTPAVRDLLLLAGAGRLRGVVVGDVDDFAADRDDALFVAVTLAGRGVRIVEADPGRPAVASRHRPSARPRSSRSLAGVAS